MCVHMSVITVGWRRMKYGKRNKSAFRETKSEARNIGTGAMNNFIILINYSYYYDSFITFLFIVFYVVIIYSFIGCFIEYFYLFIK